MIRHKKTQVFQETSQFLKSLFFIFREATQERQIATTNLKHTCYYISYLLSVDGHPVRREFTTLTDIFQKKENNKSGGNDNEKT